ncbi:MAG: pilus assembly protein PilM, partial [Candidatus Omnitrophota bacterium]|nr:pilus assembly protein PilM [Candidatus Omnitrophota bacterium]
MKMIQKRIFTVVEVTDSHVKLMQSRKVRGKVVISACDVRPITNQSDEDVIRTVRDMTLTRAIQSDDFIFVIPRRLAIFKRLKLPSQQETEIKKMVGLQLVNHIPYAIDDVMYETHVVDKDAAGYTHVLVAIVHKDVVGRYYKLFTKLGLHPAKFVLSSFGLLGWLNFQETKKRLDSRYTMVLVNMDVAHTEICFFHDKKILYSRHVNYGAKDLNEDGMMGLLNQIDLSLSSYTREAMGPEFKKIVILTLLTEGAILKDKCENNFKISAEAMTALENILCQKNINLSTLQNQSGLSFSVCLGYLLSDARNLMNFMPQEVHVIKQSKRRRMELVKLISLVFLAAVLAYAILGLRIYRKHEILNKIVEESGRLNPALKKAKEQVQFEMLLQKEFQAPINMVDLIAELYAMTPPEISFRSLQIDERDRLTIQGYSLTSGAVNNFQAA